MIKICDRFHRNPTVKEINSGERLTETSGYIPPKLDITRLILAGKQLEDFRKYQFDFPEGTEIDETYTDILRQKNLDMAEISLLKQDLDFKIKEYTKAQQRAEFKKKKEFEEKKKAPEEEQNTPPE